MIVIVVIWQDGFVVNMTGIFLPLHGLILLLAFVKTSCEVLMQHCPLGHIRLRNLFYLNMESIDLPTGYNPDQYIQFTLPCPVGDHHVVLLAVEGDDGHSVSIHEIPLLTLRNAVTRLVPLFDPNTNSDTDFQPTPLPIIRQNAFTES